jgi:hypothetical protein
MSSFPMARLRCVFTVASLMYDMTPGEKTILLRARGRLPRRVPPTASLHTPDPRLGIGIATAPTATRIDLTLSNSFGFGGQNAVLATAKA